MGAGSDESCRAALEAMAAGRPVVAARGGRAARTRWSHGETGLLVDDDRPESVRAPCARSSPIPAVARRHGRGGRERRASRTRHARSAHAASRWRRCYRHSGSSTAACEAEPQRPAVRVSTSCRAGGGRRTRTGPRGSAPSSSGPGTTTTLVCKAGSRGPRHRSRARRAASSGIETLALSRAASRPASDARDLRALLALAARAPTSSTSIAARSTGSPRIANRLSPRAAAPRAHAPHRPADPAARPEPLALRPGDRPRRHGDRGHPPPVSSRRAVPRRRVVALPGGVDVERFRPGRRRRRPSPRAAAAAGRPARRPRRRASA